MICTEWLDPIARRLYKGATISDVELNEFQSSVGRTCFTFQASRGGAAHQYHIQTGVSINVNALSSSKLAIAISCCSKWALASDEPPAHTKFRAFLDIAKPVVGNTLHH